MATKSKGIYHRWTTEELELMKTMKLEKGMTYAQIATDLGISKSAVENCFQRWINKTLGGVSKPAPAATAPVISAPSLSSFHPRDIIKHMYKLGYRIENNELVCYQKHVVNIKDCLQ